MLLKILIAFAVALWVIWSAVRAIKTIRAEPPFTIIEKREKIDAEARKRIEEMIDNMDKD